MNKKADLTVLVLHAHSEERLLDQVLEQLSDVEVVFASEAFGNLTRPAAIRNLVVSSNVVVAVVPNAPARGRTSVVFQVGIAVGAGVPVLLVTSSDRLGPELRDLPRLDPEALRSLRQALQSVRESHYYSDARVKPGEVQVLRKSSAAHIAKLPTMRAPDAFGEDWVKPTEAVMQELALALREGGARVQCSGEPEQRNHGIAGIPDMVIWHDGLQSSLGLPLPVEIVRAAGSLSKIQRRLATTLKHSGGRSMLVVTAGPSKPSCKYLDEGLLVSVSVHDLLSRLRTFPLPEAMASILEEAR